jgi:glycosyltransferase involved in cell wall biosynthesis
MDITVVIPLYNKRDSIQRAINSVIRQTITPKIIIVVDDGSTDGSLEVVASMNNPYIRLLKQENNGVSAARNRGLKEANTPWVAFLDGDDEWLPDFLLTVNMMHAAFPEHDVYGTSYFSGDYEGNKKAIILNHIPFSGTEGVLTNYFVVASSSAPPLWSSAVCIRKQALLDIDGFPPNMKSGEDLITWARLVSSKPPVYSTVPLAVFWQDKAHTYDDKPNRIPEKDDPIGKALLKLKIESPSLGIERYVSHWHKMRASIYLRLNMRLPALKECLKGISFYPANTRLYFYIFLLFFPYPLVLSLFKKFGR